jgi:hypothetical protein
LSGSQFVDVFPESVRAVSHTGGTFVCVNMVANFAVGT